MHEHAYYTGAFDPMHTGHIGSLRFAYAARPFKKLLLGIGYNNPRKPNVTPLDHRAHMARLLVDSEDLPFEVEILPFDYQDAERTIREKIPTNNTLRIVESDSLVSYIAEMQERDEKWDPLLPFHHLVLIRPLPNAGVKELEAAINTMSPNVRVKFSYQIAGIHDTPVESRDIRHNLSKSYKQGLITKDMYDYIKKHSLYKQG